ncbi:hypothetical protein BU25DRAFT_157034 [Macroventuria anomochaeta]|uniref:Uncharacterized protein n=1 Tax=Macroventuria anomochaeta TaxID=301207 RepID=A0ACB6RTX5_9PLEO|nr:uncharacterized protein BU25DRAFT_157034 [Macroventuria anomochaeta]KAF2624277.1 hypothetical protein BU25DRAFT_157034 [Macroventuria anomochaeta]
MKTKNNVAQNLCDACWISSPLHPAQSPDLNPIGACWAVLKQRVKKCLRWPNKGQPAWDGTKRMLKKIFIQEWNRITIEEVSRCAQLQENNGEKICSALW